MGQEFLRLQSARDVWSLMSSNVRTPLPCLGLDYCYVRPTFIVLRSESSSDPRGAIGVRPALDPARALACLHPADPGRDGGVAERERSAGTGAGSGHPLDKLPEIDSASLVYGLRETRRLTSREHGQEHEVFFDAQTQRVVKLTKPGLYGARGCLSDYLKQMEYGNRRFQDDVMIEGWALMPGEHAPRLVATQSWCAGRLSTAREIAAYMTCLGFAEIFEGAWWHTGEEVKVTDALPKNFRTLPGGWFSQSISSSPGPDQPLPSNGSRTWCTPVSGACDGRVVSWVWRDGSDKKGCLVVP